jgi:hypothetical protein
MRPPLHTHRPQRLPRWLRNVWEMAAPCLLLVSLLALVAHVPRWTS